MWPFLIPGSVLDLYPVIFSWEHKSSVTPWIWELIASSFMFPWGVLFLHCKMRKENTTKIHLEQHEKHCPRDPCKEGNVSVWNVLQTIKIMNRQTVPVVLCTSWAYSSNCWPPYSIKIRTASISHPSGNEVPMALSVWWGTCGCPAWEPSVLGALSAGLCSQAALQQSQPTSCIHLCPFPTCGPCQESPKQLWVMLRSENCSKCTCLAGRLQSTIRLVILV